MVGFNENARYYTAVDMKGIHLHIPNTDMVVVLTGYNELNFYNPGRLLTEFILPAAK
jgi:hypothetical protein